MRSVVLFVLAACAASGAFTSESSAQAKPGEAPPAGATAPGTSPGAARSPDPAPRPDPAEPVAGDEGAGRDAPTITKIQIADHRVVAVGKGLEAPCWKDRGGGTFVLDSPEDECVEGIDKLTVDDAARKEALDLGAATWSDGRTIKGADGTTYALFGTFAPDGTYVKRNVGDSKQRKAIEETAPGHLFLVDAEDGPSVARVTSLNLAKQPAPEWSVEDCFEQFDVFTAIGETLPSDAAEQEEARTEAKKELLARLVCVDLLRGSRVVTAPPDGVLAPNEGLIVVVRHEPEEAVAATLGGTPGLSAPSVVASDGEQEAAGADDGAVRPTFSVLRFAPRKAGTIGLSVTTSVGGTEAKRIEVELVVEKRHAAAIRIGVGTLVGHFVGYEAVTIEGSQQAQINETFVPVQFELVTGIALYPEVLWGGRSYTRDFGCDNLHIAPYVGFGLVGQQIDAISALTSFHAGLDVEATSEISLGFTFVARRAKRLAAGYAPGSPVSAGSTAFLEDGIDPGFAVILNATPDFFKFEQ